MIRGVSWTKPMMVFAASCISLRVIIFLIWPGKNCRDPFFISSVFFTKTPYKFPVLEGDHKCIDYYDIEQGL